MENNLNDNSNINNDEIYTSDEYQAALDILDKKKRKETIKSKKAKEKEEKKKDFTPEKYNTFFKRFLYKCKNDIIIPIAMLLTIIIVVALIIFYLPHRNIKSLNITVNELSDTFKNTNIYTASLENFDFSFDLDNAQYTKANNNETIQAKAEELIDSKYINKVDFFDIKVNNSANLNTAIQGLSSRKNNNIIALSVTTEFNSEQLTSIIVYLSNFVQSLNPTMSDDEIGKFTISLLEKTSDKEAAYTNLNNFAYKATLNVVDDVPLLTLNIIPIENVNE